YAWNAPPAARSVNDVAVTLTYAPSPTATATWRGSPGAGVAGSDASGAAWQCGPRSPPQYRPAQVSTEPGGTVRSARLESTVEASASTSIHPASARTGAPAWIRSTHPCAVWRTVSGVGAARAGAAEARAAAKPTATAAAPFRAPDITLRRVRPKKPTIGHRSGYVLATTGRAGRCPTGAVRWPPWLWRCTGNTALGRSPG